MPVLSVSSTVIEYPVVYPFVRSAVTVGLLIFLRSPRDRGIEPDVPVRIRIGEMAFAGAVRIAVF